MASDYKTITIPIAHNIPGRRIGGINNRDESIGFEGNFTPDMKNMVIDGTKLRKRLGYSEIGSTSLPLTGTGMSLIDYTDARGTSHLIALTTTDAYHYDTTNDEWDEITPVAGDFTGANTNNWIPAIATDTTEFSNNGGTALLITNGVENIFYFEGQSNDKFQALTTGFASFASTRSIIEFWNHFFLLDFTDSARHAKSFAYASGGDIDNWTTGTSGETVLTDSVGNIQRAMKLGYDMIVYSEQSITSVSYVGGVLIFNSPTVINDTGLFDNRAVEKINGQHYFIGTDQRIYQYRGGKQIVDIGHNISKDLFERMSVSNKSKLITGIDNNRQKLYFGFPTSSSSYAKSFYVINYSLTGEPWEYYEFAHSMRGAATLINNNEAYCDEEPYASYYCDEVSFYCDDSFGEVGYPITCFLSDDGYVFRIDEQVGTDSGTDISCHYVTEDIKLDPAENIFRTIWVSFESKTSIASGTVEVQYSTDGGESYSTLIDSPVSLTSNWITNKLPLDASARRIRFKFFQNSDKDFQIRGVINVGITSASER